jgi:glycine C-acetyltransferase
MEGAVSSKINFNDCDMITWTFNNYLGLTNNEAIKSIDKEA